MIFLTVLHDNPSQLIYYKLETRILFHDNPLQLIYYKLEKRILFQF